MTCSALKLTDKERADARLEVRITEYTLSSIGFSSEDDQTSRSREYRIWITADAVLRNTNTGAIIAESIGVRGKTTFLITAENAQGDIVAAKRSGLSAACSDLAREIVDATTEIW
jgi:hypothetical protein